MAEITQVNKYNNSKIYKISSNITDKYYIGSTTQTLAQRLSVHIRAYKHYIKTNNRYITSFEIIKLGDSYITLIEENTFNNKQQLFKREGEIIKLNINNVVNKMIAGRTDKEWRQDNHETILEKKKQYREDNKQVIASKEKEHYNNNKVRINLRNNIYHSEHKEQKKQYDIINRVAHLEYNKIPFNCICGVTITLNGKSQHMRTPKHINQLFNNELNYYNL